MCVNVNLLDILVKFRDYSFIVVKKYAKMLFIDFSWAIDTVNMHAMYHVT